MLRPSGVCGIYYIFHTQQRNPKKYKDLKDIKGNNSNKESIYMLLANIAYNKCHLLRTGGVCDIYHISHTQQRPNIFVFLAKLERVKRSVSGYNGKTL